MDSYLCITGGVVTEKKQPLPWVFQQFRKFLAKTPQQGCQTTLYCCLEESIANDSGKFYSDCKEVRGRATSEADQKRLWDLSEKMVGLKTE